MTAEEKAYQIDNSQYNNTLSTLTHLPPVPLRISDELKGVLLLNDVPIAVTATTSQQPLPTGATPISKFLTHTFAGTATITVYTPTAGKKLYITAANLYSTSSGTLAFGDNIAAWAADDTIYEGFYARFAATTNVPFFFQAPMVVSTALKLYAGAANGFCIISFEGYEL